MQKRYIFTALMILVMIFVVALVAERNNCDSSISEQFNFKSELCGKFTPRKLLLESVNNTRYMDVDELASHIVAEDPSYVPVDVRDIEQFKKYSLPKAINIPFDKVVEYKDSNDDLKSDTYNKVLFANSTLLADQAWVLMRRMGYKNVKVLKGGLNGFFTTLMNPPAPKETDSGDTYDLYSFRKAASVYFGMPNPMEFVPKVELNAEKYGQKRASSAKPKAAHKAKKTVTPKKKAPAPKPKVEEEEEEGC